jgi:hypothetical protein
MSEKNIKVRTCKELKEIISKLSDTDLFWMDKDGKVLFIKCMDKDSESYREIISLQQVLELY